MSDTQASAPADEVECNCPDLLFCKRNGGCTKLDSAPAAPAETDLDALVAWVTRYAFDQVDPVIDAKLREAAQAITDLRAKLAKQFSPELAAMMETLRDQAARTARIARITRLEAANAEARELLRKVQESAGVWNQSLYMQITEFLAKQGD